MYFDIVGGASAPPATDACYEFRSSVFQTSSRHNGPAASAVTARTKIVSISGASQQWTHGMNCTAILRLPDVERITGLSRSTIYVMMKGGYFPRSLQVGRRAVGWREAEVQDWLASRPAAGEPL